MSTTDHRLTALTKETLVNTPGITLAREIARVHAARAAIGFWGKPITRTLLKATTWNGTARGLRDILAHYRHEFSRESDRHRVGNAHLGRLEIWAGTRWPEASDAWKWGYRWTEDHTGRLVGEGYMETADNRPTDPGWWLIAALLDYRPVLDQATPEQVRAWAPEVLETAAEADQRGGLGGIAIDWVRAAIREVAPDADLTVPAKVTPSHVRSLYLKTREGDTGAAIVAGPLGDVTVTTPTDTHTVLYTGQELAEYVAGDFTPDPDDHTVKCLVTGINGRIDGVPGLAHHLTEPCPTLLEDDIDILADVLQARSEGRDVVLGRDRAARYRTAPAATAAERGWQVLDLDKLTPATGDPVREEQVGIGWGPARWVLKIARMADRPESLYWTSP